MMRKVWKPMEELRSTEILDREILEDARKKAFRILKTADDTVKAADERWEKKAKRAGADIARKYAERTEKTRTEIMARLPLDKRRARSEKIEALLQEAMEGALAGFSRERLLGLLEKELARRLDFCRDEGELESALGPGAAPVFFYRNISRDEAAAIFGRLLPPELRPGPEALAEAGTAGAAIPGLPAGDLPLMGIDSRKARITASIETASADLLREKRAELLSALLGREAAEKND
jgi:hypothetical protein